ncbi:reverse transcriptase domain-containing protein, partial [Tanacetum coccineum]
MKLNPKKCSFGVEEGKFLGYMVTSEGIRANPKKTKAVAYMESPKTLKEMQSLSGKLVALKRFLSKSAERALPFFETLKNITKENKDKYRVITDQPIKQILNKSEVFSKLAKYAVGLGAYNITYVPRNAIKGQVLADFINEIPAETKHLEIYSLMDEKNLEEWTLYTNGASSLKGVAAGLVLIDPAGTEYTYAIWLTFPITNNEAEYEALLAGLRIAHKIKVQALKKADVLSKLASIAFNHLTKEVLVEVLNAKSMDAQEVNTIIEEEEDNWMTPIIKGLDEGVWQTDENEARAFLMKIGQYVMEEGVLFKKSYMSLMLRCVGPLQANYIIREVHEGECGMHSRARSVVAKVMIQ